jgi:hypothetical protein
MRERPLVGGGVLAVAGLAGDWLIVHNLSHWPSWMLFPSMLLAAPLLAVLMIGLGVVTICALEPLLGKMPLNWDAEPLTALALPFPLQRKLERLGFWTADDLAAAVERGTFPWTAVEFAERTQIDVAARRWARANAALAEQRRAQRRPFWSTRAADGETSGES